MIFDRKSKFLITFIFLIMITSSKDQAIYSMETETFRLNDKSNNCLRTPSKDTCDRALVYTEVLQRRAAKDGNYPCQTILLGLEANLIMSNLYNLRKPYVPVPINNVQEICGYE